MGTNFYLKVDPCPHCGRSDERLHIGKSSAGWCFALHVIPEEGIDGLEAWERRWQSGIIENEYGERLTPEEMRQTITERAWKAPPSAHPANFYNANHAEPGPNNLLRSKRGPYCVGHGEGTWDLIPGEFS